MRFNRETEADRAAKNFAKKQAGKAAQKAGKKAAKAAGKATSAIAQKIVTAIVSAIGTPAALVILVAVLVLIVLPSMIFGASFGTDSKYDSDELGATAVGSGWEDDAEQAIEERYHDMKIATFWSDLGTFFTSGRWGQEGARFETEFSNASDADEEGTDGYFSSSNRLIALINEAFRLSLSRSRIKSEAIAMANQAIPELEEEIRSSAEYGRPSNVAESDYTINISVEPDPDFNEDQNFIYESCYVLAATSSMVNDMDSFDVGTRMILDRAFSITGLDGNTDQEICWEKSVSTEILSSTTDSYTHHYVVTDSNGVTTEYPNLDSIPEELRGSAEAVEYETKEVNAVVYYSISLSPNFKEIVNSKCNIETALPEDAAAYEISQADQVNSSALELTKFYGVTGGDWAEIGEAGLPLPRGSYWISSEFGWRVLGGSRDFHKGIDLAAAMGTPVYAIKDGVCTVSGHDASYGNCVSIDHGDGLMTRYAHMSVVAVTDGQSVTAGEIIGYVGSTGNSTGPHLHFEVRQNGTPIDPLSTELGSEIRNGATR